MNLHRILRINMQKNQNGITNGVIWKQLLAFFFPILFGTFFQQLYNTVDAIVVGQFIGKQALAAVGGGTTTAINLIIGFFTGLSSGATVIISQFYGAGDEDKVRRSIHNAWTIAIIAGVLVSLFGIFFSGALLRLIDTPSDVYEEALIYMQIFFGGGIVTVLYNMGAGIYRAFGDSKRPLYFLIIGCVVNIFADLLFVGVFKLGVAGAAYASVASQVVSLILVVAFQRRRDDCCKLEYKQICFDKNLSKQTISIGLPSGIQSVLYTISNLIIVANVNSFGTDTAAAWSAYGKLDCFYWMIVGAFGISITTFVGQNYGAGKLDRAKSGVKTCMLIALITTIILEAIFVLFGRPCYKMFTNDASVIELGMKMLLLIAPFFFTYLPVEILSGAIRGTGKTLIPTIITLCGICGFRILWLQIVPRLYNTLVAVLLCYPVSWILTGTLFIFYYKFGHIYTSPKD